MAKDGTEEIEAGLVDEGGMIDEESGNDVPNGALKEEVRDDQPAMLSPGEFVMPAYAVRYFGVENLVKMLRAAKQGMEQLDDMGLTGEPNSNDDMLASAVLPTEKEDGPSYFQTGGVQAGGVTTAVPQRPTQTSFIPPVPAAAVAPAPVTQAAYAPTVPIRPTTPTYTYPQFVYSPQGAGGGYGVEEYVGPNGEIIYVTTIGGKPIGGVPTGYKKASDVTDQPQIQPITTPPSELKLQDGSPDQAQLDAAQNFEQQDLSAENVSKNQINSWIAALEGEESKFDAKDFIPAILNPALGLTSAGIKALSDFLGNATAKANSTKFMTEDNKFISKDKWDKQTDKQKAQTLKDFTTGEYVAPITEEGQAGSVGSSENWATVQTETPGRAGYITPQEAAAAALTGRTVAIAPSVDATAPSFDTSAAPGGISAADVAAGGGEGGTYGFKKGGLISMSDGGMITVGDKTYSPEDFGFASKGALVKKRKTPAKKKRGKGLASSK